MSYKGSKVLTFTGYKPIESITLLDKLIESDGVFRHPKRISEKNATHTYKIDTQFNAKSIHCDENQSFLTRDSGNPWKKAYELTTDDYIGMVRNKFDIIPCFTFNEDNTSYSTFIDTKEEWYLLGYYIANGWIEADNEIRFIVHDKQILQELRKVLPLKAENLDCFFYKMFDKKKQFTTYKCSHNIWYKILKLLQKKQNSQLIIEIPEWVQNAPIEFIKEFIRGYENNRLIGNIYTSSYSTALGLQRLYAKIGIVVALYNNNINNTFIAYEDNNLRCILDDYVWYAVSHIEEEESSNVLYSIETSKGFVIENIVLSNAYKK